MQWQTTVQYIQVDQCVYVAQHLIARWRVPFSLNSHLSDAGRVRKTTTARLFKITAFSSPSVTHQSRGDLAIHRAGQLNTCKVENLVCHILILGYIYSLACKQSRLKKKKKSSASLDSCIGVSWLALAAAFMLHIARSFITCLTTSWLITSNHANAVCCCSSLNHSSLLLPMCYIFGIVDLTLISSPDRIFFCHSDPLGGTSKSRAFPGTVQTCAMNRQFLNTSLC